MECEYTHLNHNSLVSPNKKMMTKGVIIKGVYCSIMLNYKLLLFLLLNITDKRNYLLGTLQPNQPRYCKVAKLYEASSMPRG
jgi:hypothetical protein